MAPHPVFSDVLVSRCVSTRCEANPHHGRRVVAVANFDGNGVPDLVYQNTQTGQVNVDYYGGARGAVLKGWNVLSATGNPGGTPVVPKSR